MTENTVLTPYIEASKGLLWFFMGILISTITFYIVPALFSAFESVRADSVPDIYTYILFLIWGLLIIIFPSYKTGMAIRTIGTEKIHIIIGILWVTFGIILSFVGYYIAPALANMMPHGILKAMFWAGFIIQWGIQILGVGAAAIIKGSSS